MASSEILQTLRDLPPRHFEQFVADVWQERQEWTTEVMDAGPDSGLDVIGEPPGGGPKTAVQCKRYRNRKVTSRDIREYASLRMQWEDVQGVTLVTTSSFTRDARETAARVDVKCIDGDKLVSLIRNFNAEDILEWYTNDKPEER